MNGILSNADDFRIEQDVCANPYIRIFGGRSSLLGRPTINNTNMAAMQNSAV
jgi:hypothetical protein